MRRSGCSWGGHIGVVHLAQIDPTRIGHDLDIGAVVELLLLLGAAETRASVVGLAEIVAGVVAPLEDTIAARDPEREQSLHGELAVVFIRHKVLVAVESGWRVGHDEFGRAGEHLVLVVVENDEEILVEALLFHARHRIVVVLAQTKLEIAVVIRRDVDHDRDLVALTVRLHDLTRRVLATRLVLTWFIVPSVLNNVITLFILASILILKQTNLIGK